MARSAAFYPFPAREKKKNLLHSLSIPISMRIVDSMLLNNDRTTIHTYE